MNVDAIIKNRQLLIGERIKEMRNKAKLTQSQLAALMSNGLETDRGKSTISEYEHGKHLTLENIIKIYSILNNCDINCDLNYLLGCQDHPDITTSWIAEQIPLRRDAIEALQNLNYKLDAWSDSESQFFGYYILSDLIIHFAKALEYEDFIDDKGKLVHHDNLLGNIIDMQFAYESIVENESMNDTPFEIDKNYRKEILTIRGSSSWIGENIAETVRKSVKDYADPKNVITKEV